MDDNQKRGLGMAFALANGARIRKCPKHPLTKCACVPMTARILTRQHDINLAVLWLLEESTPFCVTPLPDDKWRVRFKQEIAVRWERWVKRTGIQS